MFSLLSTDSQLLSAGNGEVSAWNWSELIKRVRLERYYNLHSNVERENTHHKCMSM